MRLFLHQLRCDQRVFWRGRESAFFVFMFPVLLFLLLSTVYGGHFRGRPVSDYLTTSLIAYGVANTAFGGLAILLVVRRENGLLKRVRSTPLPAPVYLAATVTSTLLVFALQAVLIVLLGTFLYDADLPSNWWSLAGAYAIAALAFAGMGLGAASLIRSAEGAPAVVNVLVLPMTFLSGGFGPTRHFPDVLKAIANVLPLTYLVNIVVDVVFEGKALVDEVGAIAVIVAWGVAGIAVAARYFRWEPREG